MHIAGFPNMIMCYSSHANREDEVYYYHGDLCGSRAQSQACMRYAEMQQSVRSKHLGSASWITNNYGSAVQHLQYLPYGEPFVNQRTSGYNERFTFTGNDPRKGWRIPLNRIKYNEQRDEETGYGYFGDNPNCLIIAPTNSLGVSNNIERVINKGCWRFFYNGEMIYCHSGGW